MKKLLSLILLTLLIPIQSYSATEWTDDAPAYTTKYVDECFSDVKNNSTAAGRLLSRYRMGMKLEYASAATLTVALGEVCCTNSGDTVRKMRKNPSSTTVTWSDLDTGSEATSTTYYVYAVADADATTATFNISISATAPSGATNYRRLGSFYNDASGNITAVTNDEQTNWANIVSSYSYDSGWFAVSQRNVYTKTHNLNTTKVISALYYAANSDGSGVFYGTGALTSWRNNDQGSIKNGLAIDALSTTTVRINFGDELIAPNGANGEALGITSGYCRVILIALE